MNPALEKLRFRTVTQIVLLLILAGGLRFAGLGWGLPHHFHSDEDVMMYWAEQFRTAPSMDQLVNHQYFYVYSPLPLYWTAGGAYLRSLHKELLAADPDSINFRYLWARSFSAILGTLTVALVFLCGLELGRVPVALISGFLLAVLPIHIQNSHFFTAEIPFTFFSTGVLLFSLRLIRTGYYRDALLAGVSLGFTALCKYTAIAFLPVLIVAAMIAAIRQNEHRKTMVFVWRILLPCITGGLVFFIGDPWIFLNPKGFVKTFQMISEWSSGLRTPLWTAQFSDVHPGLYWFTNLLPGGIGYPVLAAGLAGVIAGIYRRSTAMVLVLVYAAAYFLLVGFSYMQYIRYTVPAGSALTLMAGFGIHQLLIRSAAGSGRRIVSGSVIGLILAFTAFRGLATASIYLQEDVRHQASRWIHATFPQGQTCVTDNSAFRPPLGSERTDISIDSNLVLRGGPYTERRDYYIIRLLDLYNHVYRTDHTSQDRIDYLTRRIENADFIVLSEESVVQYSHVAGSYPEVNRFLEDLVSGRTAFSQIKFFQVFPRLGPFVWNDSSVELSWRLFDHPRIWVLYKQPSDVTGVFRE